MSTDLPWSSCVARLRPESPEWNEISDSTLYSLKFTLLWNLSTSRFWKSIETNVFLVRLCVKDVCYWKCGDTTCYRRACCPITKMGNFDDKSRAGWRKMISRTILLWPAAGRAAGQRVCCPICHFPSFPADKQPFSEKGLGLRVSYLDKNITERGKNTLTDKCSVGQSEKVLLACGRLRVYANVQKFWRCKELVVGGDTLHTEKLRNFHCNDLWPAIASVSRSSARQFRAICLTGKNIHASNCFLSRYSVYRV